MKKYLPLLQKFNHLHNILYFSLLKVILKFHWPLIGWINPWNHLHNEGCTFPIYNSPPSSQIYHHISDLPPSSQIYLPHLRFISLISDLSPSSQIYLPHLRFTSLIWDSPPSSQIDLFYLYLFNSSQINLWVNLNLFHFMNSFRIKPLLNTKPVSPVQSHISMNNIHVAFNKFHNYKILRGYEFVWETQRTPYYCICCV